MEESGSRTGTHSSQPLRTALHEMEEQARSMLKFMEQENDSLDDGTEKTYRRRTELTLLFEELSRSYQSLSNHFKSDSTYTTSSSTSSLKEIEQCKSYVQRFDESKLKVCNYQSQSVAGDSDDENNTGRLKCLNQLAEDFMSTELDNMNLEDIGSTSFLANDYLSMNHSKLRHNVGDLSSGNFHWKNAWRTQEFQFQKLMDENLQKQEELVRRNNNKREVKKELRFQLRRMMGENRDLQRCIIGSKGDVSHGQSRISRLREIILDKLWRKRSSA